MPSPLPLVPVVPSSATLSVLDASTGIYPDAFYPDETYPDEDNGTPITLSGRLPQTLSLPPR